MLIFTYEYANEIISLDVQDETGIALLLARKDNAETTELMHL